MTILHLVFNLFMTFGISTSLNAMEKEVIRLVFMGKTGAGKSTAINACYNFAEQKKWHEYPKLFSIPTEFQDCNVESYRERAVENHQQGQLEAVTQEASEYLAEGLGYKVSLIDCPGTGDPRGIRQDTINTNATSKFLANMHYVNAFCIVVKSTTNRETAEEAYCIDQIKALLPLKARDRIFIIVTHDTGARENIQTFTQAVGLPLDNIFYFDNFALTKAGHIDLANINLNENDQDNLGDPFNEPEGHDCNGEIVVGKIRTSWLKSHKQFNRMIKTARDLGIFPLDVFRDISIKRYAFALLFSKGMDYIEALESCELESDSARKELACVTMAKSQAYASYESVKAEHSRALTVAANNARPSNSSFFVYMAEADRIKLIVLQKAAESGEIEAILAKKYERVRAYDAKVVALGRERDVQISLICDELLSLDRMALCSLNFQVPVYYDLCIRRELNHQKKERLNREKGFYLDIIAKYRDLKN